MDFAIRINAVLPADDLDHAFALLAAHFAALAAGVDLREEMFAPGSELSVELKDE